MQSGVVALCWAWGPTCCTCADAFSLPAGFSVKQLSGVCQALADAADRLPHLSHLSMGMELDALLTSSNAAGVAPLAAMKQITSLAFVEYQVRTPMRPTAWVCAHAGMVQQVAGVGWGLSADMALLACSMLRFRIGVLDWLILLSHLLYCFHLCSTCTLRAQHMRAMRWCHQWLLSCPACSP